MFQRIPGESLILAAAITITAGAALSAKPVTLECAGRTVIVDPATLAVNATVAGATSQQRLSVPQYPSPSIRMIKASPEGAEWLDDYRKIQVSAAMDAQAVTMEFRTTTPQELQWPVIEPASPAAVYLLPLGMGNYVPASHEGWQAHLSSESPMRMTEGFSMPFLGLLESGRTTTWLFDNEFHNAVSYARSEDGLLTTSVTHSFTTAALQFAYRVRIIPGKGDLLEPVRLFRGWADLQGRLVSLDQKAAETTAVELLRGAAHVYLWGGDPLCIEDVKDWKGVVADLKQAETNTSHPVRELIDSMTDADRISVKAMLTDQLLIRYTKLEFLRALNRQIPEIGKSLAPNATTSVQIRRGCEDVAARFSGRLAPVETWGGIMSPESIGKFKSAGIDRLWLGLPSWRMGLAHPEGVEAAREAGYLIAPYDSYNSVHPPGLADTWETAQFDADLYEHGAIVAADGTTITGFRKVGHMLSPLAARPYFERRISGIMKQVPFNSWFVDADAFGDFFDNYSQEFPHTQQQDAGERTSRLRWAAKRFGLVMGSEGGISFIVPAIAFAHGMMTPVIGWGDREMQQERLSPYYLGRYYPPEQPDRFFKQVRLKPEYATFYFDPQYRIPLYPLGLGDCIVVTHQWGFPSRKFADQWQVVRLTELLYGVPPLEHVSSETIDNWLIDFMRYYKVFSPLHRVVAGKAMTDFRYLTPDRLVQQSTFGSAARVTVNFGANKWQDIGPLSARIEYLAEGKTVSYSMN